MNEIENTVNKNATLYQLWSAGGSRFEIKLSVPASRTNSETKASKKHKFMTGHFTMFLKSTLCLCEERSKCISNTGLNTDKLTEKALTK